MSTDFTVICDECHSYVHLGQRFTTGPCFGYSNDDIRGRLIAAEFISQHIYHALRVVVTDHIPVSYDPADGIITADLQEQVGPPEVCEAAMPPAPPSVSTFGDAYVIPFAGEDRPWHINPSPSPPDRVKGAPKLVLALTLYPGSMPPVTRQEAVRDVQQGIQLTQGSLEGMKELLCGILDRLWRISRL